MKFTLEQVAHLIDGEIVGDGSLEVIKISNIESAESGSITFLSNPKYEPFIYSTKATGIIVDKSIKLKQEVSNTLILVDDPYSSFTVLLAEYERLTALKKQGIEQPSHVSGSCTYGENLYLGAFAYIGEGVVLGKNVKIFPNTYIGDNSEIGDNSILHPGVKVYANTKIGKSCTIHSGVVLGSDGFGFAPQADGTYKSIPQVGNVIVEDYVDIGANTVVDCATFDSTIIKKGVKLDNLIQIAHNVVLGENTVVAAQAGISGSTTLGNNCIIGGQAGIVGHLKLGDGTKIQAQSGVTKNTKEGIALYGSPAIGYSNYIKSYAVFKKLPELLSRITELEEKILNLPPIKD